MPEIIDLGVTEYSAALALQEDAVRQVTAGGREVVFLTEHTPVYTIGSGGRLENVLDPAITPHRINRGGDVTYHGPGQLVIYPLLDLGRRGRDLHGYLRFLEALVITVVARSGIGAHTVPGRTGVWTETGKIASIGVGVRRWISMHGCAVNVSTPAEPFQLINPCGIAACPVTSLTRESGREISLQEVAAHMRAIFPRLVARDLPLLR